VHRVAGFAGRTLPAGRIDNRSFHRRMAMKRWLALVIALSLAVQSSLAFAAGEPPIQGPDTRIYLKDGSLLEGSLVEKSNDLIIVRVDRKIVTVDRREIDKIVTVDSLGGGARTISVTEFPYISFLGGTAAFSLLAWLQFDRSSSKQKDADQNRGYPGQEQRVKKLEDQADRARLYGWTAAALAAGSLGVALIPRKTTRRVFPELSFRDGAPTLQLVCVRCF
jgi:hypothetical protein